MYRPGSNSTAESMVTVLGYTTNAVVSSAILILAANFALTSLLFAD